MVVDIMKAKGDVHSFGIRRTRSHKGGIKESSDYNNYKVNKFSVTIDEVMEETVQ